MTDAITSDADARATEKIPLYERGLHIEQFFEIGDMIF